MHRLLQQRVVDLPGGLDSSELTSRLAEHAGQGAEDEKEAVVADVAPAGVRGEVLGPLGQHQVSADFEGLRKSSPLHVERQVRGVANVSPLMP